VLRQRSLLPRWACRLIQLDEEEISAYPTTTRRRIFNPAIVDAEGEEVDCETDNFTPDR